MTVKVKFLATFKMLFGAASRELDLPDGTTAGGLLEIVCDTPERRREVFASAPKGTAGPPGALKPHVVVMRNGSPAALGDALAGGDVVAVFPFVSGG